MREECVRLLSHEEIQNHIDEEERKFISNMGQDAWWGGELEARVLSEFYQINLFVVVADNKKSKSLFLTKKKRRFSMTLAHHRKTSS